MNDEYRGAMAPDMSWIEGRLHWTELEGGFWEIEFGDQHAPYGGRLTLGRPDQLTGATPGTRVRITGFVDERALSIFMSGAMYQIVEVELLAL